MRVGLNPHKEKTIEAPDFFHHVIVPVSIPANDNYFRDSLNVLKLCLTSLINTSHPKTYISVIDNGSTTEVASYIDSLLASMQIHEVTHTGRIGKVNAILKGLTGHRFPLITISDADVLYMPGWQKAAYEIFDAFPKAGAVCTTPLSRRLRYQTSNIYFDLMFSPKLRFTAVKNPEPMMEFARSISNEKLLRPPHLQHNLTVSMNGIRAIVGAGHFSATYKGDIFKTIDVSVIDTFAGGSALSKSIDELVIRHGYWRLSTEENYTYHMGNSVEPAMEARLATTKNTEIPEMPDLRPSKSSSLAFAIKINFLGRMMNSPRIWPRFLRWKGLSKADAAQYF